MTKKFLTYQSILSQWTYVIIKIKYASKKNLNFTIGFYARFYDNLYISKFRNFEWNVETVNQVEYVMKKYWLWRSPLNVRFFGALASTLTFFYSGAIRLKLNAFTKNFMKVWLSRIKKEIIKKGLWGKKKIGSPKRIEQVLNKVQRSKLLD